MPHSPIHTLKAHFPQCFDKNGDLMPHKLQEAILDLAQESTTQQRAEQNTPKQKDKTQSDIATDFQEKDAILSLSKETYTLNWLGKSYAKLLRHLPTNTLIAQDLTHNAKAEHKNSKNVLIKGDNLEVLKYLKNAYYNKIKMIYIDPPYNTGNDGFIYNDERNFTPQSLAQMANIELDEANKILNYTLKHSSTHSAWLSFMYPRLYIARQLLRDDGVIFISIDDNEQANLKILCDEIFGEKNFVACFVCISAPAGTQSSVFVAQQHSYILCYAKSNNNLIFNRIQKTKNELNKKYSEQDEYGFFYAERLWKRGIGGKKEDVPSLHFPVFYDEQNNKIYIDEDSKQSNVNLIKIIPYQTAGVLGRWTWSKEKMRNEHYRLIVKKVAGEWKLHKKQYKQDEKGFLPNSILGSDIARTEIGSLEIKNVMGAKVFSYPKPTNLIKQLLKIATTPHTAQNGGGGATHPAQTLRVS